MLAARDGTLWIGTDKGLASLKDGKVTHYEELARIFISTILEDRDGVIGAAGFGVPNGRPCAIQNGRTHCSGEDGVLGPGVLAVYEDRMGNHGKGIDPKVLNAGGRVGQYGFPGMYERARLVSGKPSIWSEIDSGAEAELTVPVAIAYAKSQAVRSPMFWKKGA